jgi:hypothetical protein
MNIINGNKTNVNGPKKETVWEENEVGILVAKETKLEKRDKMTRWEWKAYFNEEEITMEEYIEEQKTFLRALNGHMG